MRYAREIGKKNPLRPSENSFSTSHQVICMLLSNQVTLTSQPSRKRTVSYSTAVALHPVPTPLDAAALVPWRRKKYSDKGKPPVCLVKHASMEKSFLIPATEHPRLCSGI